MKKSIMKKKCILIILLSLYTNSYLFAQSYVCNLKGNRVELSCDPTKKIMVISGSMDSSDISRILMETNSAIGEKNIEILSSHLISVQATEPQVRELYLSLQGDTNYISISDVLRTRNGSQIWCTNKILVKTENLDSLASILEKGEISYKEFRCIDSIDRIFVVSLNGFYDKTIDIANALNKIGGISSARPSFGFFFRNHQNTNPFFGDQWNLLNTAQYSDSGGIDIQVQGAWNNATGTNVKVAVLDFGVELNHPDLANNILQGYDATQGAAPGDNGACDPGDYHGTCCSGVIAAVNNQQGTIGVAFNSRIIPIRIGYGILWFGYSTEEWIIDGIQKAWSVFNADVISCSNDFSLEEDLLDYINNAINNAIQYGRYGRGCVFVLSAGNEDGPIPYLASTNPNVMVVGGISPCGERKSPLSCDGETWWGSNFGDALDVVAPAVFVPTTDNQGDNGLNSSNTTNDYVNTDYTRYGNGTSVAAPQVAGVAALVMSVFPSLTASQICRIIKATSQKIGNYEYTWSSTNHFNGTWNNEMGHGLLDAANAVYAAMNEANNICIYDNENDLGHEPNTSQFSVSHSPDIWITDSYGNTVSSLNQGQQYNLHVRLNNFRNADVYLDGGSLSLKWTSKSGQLKWNSSFNNPCPSCACPTSGIINTPNSTIYIPANGSRVIDVVWTAPTYTTGTAICNVPTNPMYIKIVAFIDDGGLTIGVDEQDCPLEHFVRANNNVAWGTFPLYTEAPLAPIIFSISPNPADSRVVVVYDIASMADEYVDLVLMDYTGRIFYTASVTGKSSLPIDVKNIPAGTYEVMLRNNGVVYDSKTIVINR